MKTLRKRTLLGGLLQDLDLDTCKLCAGEFIRGEFSYSRIRGFVYILRNW